MKRNPFLAGILILIVGFWQTLPPAARAQNAWRAYLTAPYPTDFPQVETYLTLRSADGQPLPHLDREDLQLTEDGQPVTNFTLERVQPGLQVVIVLNPDTDFGLRDTQGVMRYTFLQSALTSWAERVPQSDDVSLLVANGREYLHTVNPQDWLPGLEIGNPRERTPNYEVFSRALDVVTESPAQPGMGRAVLLVTPLPEAGIVNNLQSLAARAERQNVVLFFWVVMAAENADLPQSNQLRALAAQTGGQVFFFSGTETIPPLDTWLQPLHHAYRIRYHSPARSGEMHNLQTVLTLGEELLTIDAPPYRYLLLPPNPIFRPMPLEIQRIAPLTVNRAATQPITLSPHSQTVEFLVDFPDEHPRQLTLARLYVDGQLAAENTTEPFTRFEWNLDSLGGPGEHRLQAEVVDTLGLRGTSNDLFVTVKTIIPTPTISEVVRAQLPLALGVAVVVLALLTVWLLLLSGRLQPRKVLSGKVKRRLPTVSWSERLIKRPPRGNTVYLGQLDPIPQNGHRTAPIRLVSDDITLGNDPSQATIVISQPAIAPTHARLKYDAQTGFRLYDLGAPAGTWCNFSPVPPEGVVLRQGDVLHFGDQAFRLTLPNAAPRTITIQPTEAHQP